MKQLRLCLSVILGLAIVCQNINNVFALEVELPALVITEIKIKNDTAPGGYNEFIELYNADTISLNLNNFTIEYYNNPATAETDDPIKKSIVADGLLLPTQTLVLATDVLQIENSIQTPFSSLADSGGLIRIKSLEGALQDEVAWTSTSALAIDPVLFLSTSATNRPKSFSRSVDDQLNPVLVDPDWQLGTPSPHSDSLQTAPPLTPEINPVPANPQLPIDPSTNPEPDQTPQPEIDIPTVNFLPLQITELLPNPAAPASDSVDEYVELYNPNTEAIDLKDYRLQTGSNYSYNHAFGSETLGPQAYKSFYVPETKTLLSNSGGRARLLSPSGQTVSEASVYEDAAEGFAWALIDGTWQWTTTPTPDNANVLTVPAAKASVVPPVISRTKPKTKPKAKASTTKATPKKTSSKAVAKPKSKKASSPLSNQANDEDGEAKAASIHPGVIAGVGLLAVAYGIYEYRFDIRNRLYQFQRYRAARLATRAKA